MDFLYLMIIYLLIFIVSSLVLLYRNAAILCTGPIGALRHYVIQAVGSLIPISVQNVMYSISNRLLFERTCFFQVIFVILCLLAHAVWLVDMIPILFTHYPNQNHTFWPFVAVFTNYYFFHKAWITDPGEITHSTLNKYKSVYEFDGIIYTGGVTCSTCKIVKPARSKHCSVCNRCVHRFDHHCIWTNNCVGAYTHRYFIMFMVSLIAMFLQGIYVGTGCILHYADDVQLFKASFVDTDGSIKPITMSVAFQHLFMALPRLVFLVVAITVLAILVFIFLCQHIYHILSNQTTNETYKVRIIHWQTVTRQNLSNHKPKERDSKCKNIHKVQDSHYRPYYRGMLENLIEVFMPDYFIKSKSKVS